MPVGVIMNCLAVLAGGILGAALGNSVPGRLKTQLNMIFGLCAMGMGINTVIQLSNLPAVIFSVIVGTAIGVLLRFEERVTRLLAGLRKPFGRLMRINNASDGKTGEAEYMAEFVTVLVLFCASANGIYGALDSGFSGEHTILISKSIMDLFTAMIFACSLGGAVSLISIPQFIILGLIFCLATVIYPLTTPEMINDLRGCGGLLLIATGFRILKLREFPVVDMIPAMILIMPVSAFWTGVIAPLL